jgi:hypothetical protein
VKLIDIGLYILDTLRGEQQDNKIKVPNGDTLGLQYIHSQRDSRTQNGEQKRIHLHVY